MSIMCKLQNELSEYGHDLSVNFKINYSGNLSFCSKCEFLFQCLIESVHIQHNEYLWRKH